MCGLSVIGVCTWCNENKEKGCLPLAWGVEEVTRKASWRWHLGWTLKDTSAWFGVGEILKRVSIRKYMASWGTVLGKVLLKYKFVSWREGIWAWRGKKGWFTQSLEFKPVAMGSHWRILRKGEIGSIRILFEQVTGGRVEDGADAGWGQGQTQDSDLCFSGKLREVY